MQGDDDDEDEESLVGPLFDEFSLNSISVIMVDQPVEVLAPTPMNSFILHFIFV